MVYVVHKKMLLVLTAALVLLIGIPCLLASSSPTTETAADVNWGLSFHENGAQPTGNASSAELAEHQALYVGDGSDKVIYLTFDAGYENGYTASILDTLKKHDVKACFFVVGHYIESAPDLVKRMVAEGHLVGNHTFSHPNMAAISEEAAFQAELQKLEQSYELLIGEKMPRLYRPPQGKYSTQNLAMAKKLGYTTVFWSLAYVDWYTDNQPTREQAFAKLLPRIHPGAVVLLHSTSETNAAILDELLTKWKAAGYRFGQLTDLV